MKDLIMMGWATYQLHPISNISSHFNSIFKPTNNARVLCLEMILSLVHTIEKTRCTQKIPKYTIRFPFKY